jgi:hypothetical protein
MKKMELHSPEGRVLGLGGRETVGGGPGYLDYTYWYYYKG